MNRILIADADVATAALYRATFADTDGDIVTAADGRDALVNAFAKPPSLVVAELRLPFIDGPELTRVLRGDYQTCDVPVLIVTAERRPLEIARAYASGADAVLLKPALPHLIVRQSQALIERAARAKSRARELQARTIVNLQRSTEMIERDEPTVRPPTLCCPSCGNPVDHVYGSVGGFDEQCA